MKYLVTTCWICAGVTFIKLALLHISRTSTTLTEKIDILRKIPNLRRIAVAPRANVRRCAEQIGRDYIFSYRPNPAEMVCCGFDPAHVRKVIRTALDDAASCCVDITLKDIQTVEHTPARLAEWVKLVREVCD